RVPTPPRRGGLSTWRRLWLSWSGQGEIIGALVMAIHSLDNLHEHIVEQRARPDAEQAGAEPVIAQCFLDHDEVGQGLFGGADAPRRLHADADAGLEKIIADGLQH